MGLKDLYSIIKWRKKDAPKDSYVASLFRKGEDEILQKIGEETTEVIVAAKGESKQRVVEEVADLFFMTLVLLVVKEISLRQVFRELERRRK